MAGLACGLSGKPWAETWLKLRAGHGMSLVGSGGCLMPCPRVGGGFSSARLTSCDGALWLRELLTSLGKEWDVNDVGAHSLKGTTLAWVAKAG
eukprot:11202720-Lingulodinium_polyedra.AAC.1